MDAACNQERNLYKELNLEETFSSRIAEAERLIQAYEVQRDLLPEVDDDGRSDCAFAEDLYYESVQREKKLRRKLSDLEECVRAVTAEINVARAAVESIDGGIRSVRTDAPKRDLTRADLMSRARYERLIDERHKLDKMLTRIREVLAQPIRRWPLGEPKHSAPGIPGIGAGGATTTPGGGGLWPIAPPPPLIAGPSWPRVTDELRQLSTLDAETRLGESEK